MSIETMNYDEASKFLGIEKKELYQLVWEKKIPHQRISKKRVWFNKDDLEKWLKGSKVKVSR